MLAASPLPPVLAPTGAPAAPLPSPALSQTPAVSALTYFATPPSIASNSLMNQRTANGVAGGAGNAAGAQAAVMSSAGLQPAPMRSGVVQEFGYSSAFMAQLIDQSSNTGLSAALRTPTYRNVGAEMATLADVKYLPSKAGVPIEIPPMTALAQRPATIRAEAPQTAPSVIEAMRAVPTRSAAELLSAQQSIQLNVATLAQGTAPAAYTAVPQVAALPRQEAAPAASQSQATEIEAPASDDEIATIKVSARVQKAVAAYSEASARLGSYSPAPVPDAANPEAAPVEAIRAVA